MSLQPSNRFTNRLQNRIQEKKDKRGRILAGSGPIGKVMIYFVEVIVIEKLLKGTYNLFIDTLESCFLYVQRTFFSDFKGFLAGKLKTKNGTCFEYTFFRYFMTLMLPPIGVFLSRGISAWYNILICGLLCFVKYFPGLVYALIVMHNAPYSKRYQQMKRERLAKLKAKPVRQSAIEISYTPLIIFIGAVLVTCLAVYLSITMDPIQSVIGDPLNIARNAYNRMLGVGSASMGNNFTDDIKGSIKSQIRTDIRQKIINKLG